MDLRGVTIAKGGYVDNFSTTVRLNTPIDMLINNKPLKIEYLDIVASRLLMKAYEVKISDKYDLIVECKESSRPSWIYLNLKTGPYDDDYTTCPVVDGIVKGVKVLPPTTTAEALFGKK